MSFIISIIKLIIYYALFGIMVNIVELIRGYLFHREEFNGFLEDMKAFDLNDRIQWTIFYIFGWPILIFISISDAIRFLRERVSKIINAKDGKIR